MHADQADADLIFGDNGQDVDLPLAVFHQTQRIVGEQVGRNDDWMARHELIARQSFEFGVIDRTPEVSVRDDADETARFVNHVHRAETAVADAGDNFQPRRARLNGRIVRARVHQV